MLDLIGAARGIRTPDPVITNDGFRAKVENPQVRQGRQYFQLWTAWEAGIAGRYLTKDGSHKMPEGGH